MFTFLSAFRVLQYKSVNKMDERNLQTVIYPTLLRPDFNSLVNISQNMNSGLFVQTCIEQAARLFGSRNVNDMSVNIVEAPSTSSLANILDESSAPTSGGTTNRLSTISNSTPSQQTGGQAGLVAPTEVESSTPRVGLDDSYEMVHDEPSFSETVLSESGLESVLGSARSTGSSRQEKTSSRAEEAEYEMILEDFETAIWLVKEIQGSQLIGREVPEKNFSNDKNQWNDLGVG